MANSAVKPSNTMPPILYKYCDLRGIDIIRSRRLKVTPFDQFNDPFELAPRMRPDFLLEDAKAAVTDPEFMRGLYELARKQGPVTDFEAFCAVIEANKDALARENVQNYARDAAEFRETHRDIVSKDFGLICLSAVFDDILMWGHYTRGHTGFVVGFDTRDSFFSAGPPVYRVQYGLERVLMGHYQDSRDDRSKVIRDLVKRKSAHWEYEREWRQLRQLSQCERMPAPDHPGKQLYFASISPGTIAEVIIGCRCQSSELIQLLNHSELAHVKMRQATMHDTNFELVFRNSR